MRARGFPSPLAPLRSSIRSRFPALQQIPNPKRDYLSTSTDYQLSALQFEGRRPSSPQNPIFPIFLRSSITISHQSHYFSTKISPKPPTTFDLARVPSFLARKDWSLALNEAFRSCQGGLDAQFVIRVLRDQEDPVFALKFYIWVSRVNYRLGKDQRVGGVLLDVLCRKGPVVLSVDLLEDIRSSGCEMTEDLFCILIGSWGRLGLAKYVSEVFGRMSVLGFRPSTRIYNSVMDALIKSNSLDLAYFKFQQMPSDGCYPDRFTYNILIHGVCKLGIIDEAVRLLKQMESAGHSANVFTYTMLVDGFCNAKKIEGAFRVLERMRKRNVLPSDATFRSLVHGAFRVLAPREAYLMTAKLLEDERIQSECVWNAILCCISKHDMANEAREFMGKMSQRGCSTDGATFNLVMTCLVKNLNLSVACQVFDDFVISGGKPGFDAYYTLVCALYKEGNDKDGDRYVSQMQLGGLVCSVVSYNLLIDVFCKAKRTDKALETFEQMLQKGFSPSLVSFNTLLNGYSVDGNNEEIRKILKMMFLQGIKPDVFTFSSIISGLCRVHQIDDALSCYEEMIEWGVPPNAVIYNILIRFCCSLGKERKARDLFMKMKAEGINPDIYSYNALILNFCKTKKTGMARNLVESMLKFGVLPDNYTYNAFVKALCDDNEVNKAKEIIDAMEASCCLPNSHSYRLIIDCLSSMGQLKVAKGMINQCFKRGIVAEIDLILENISKPIDHNANSCLC